jgi:hypothetical protein
MPKEVMRRKAADNSYLHKDFHGALSVGIEYLDQRYGPEAVRDYLRQFARAYYKPLTAALKARGLAALKEHFEHIYQVEEAAVEISQSADELVLRVSECPAVMYMRTHGHTVARLFSETTRTVNETICEGTPYTAELVDYDPQTGRSVQRFLRRKS